MDNLRKTLDELQARLAGLDRVDESTRAQIGTLLQELNRLAGEPQRPASSEVAILARRVDDLVLRLEAEHPQATDWLGQLADLVASLGI